MFITAVCFLLILLEAYFQGEIIIGGGGGGGGICISKWVGLDNKNSLKHYDNSLTQPNLTVHGLKKPGGFLRSPRQVDGVNFFFNM